MYWSDWGKGGRIMRAAMDGTRNETLMQQLGRANGLTIDFMKGLLFWTAIDKPSIESSDLSGLHRRTIIATEMQKPYGLTQYQVSRL
jgi:low density lipoprotein receptor-related protein 5/6